MIRTVLSNPDSTLNHFLLSTIIHSPWFQVSFSQFGEDLIVAGIFRALGNKKIRYFDIGAHDPFECSNTAYFYQRGNNGVCVEPNPELYSALTRKRKRDICINTGVGANSDVESEFFVFDGSSLSTFSPDEVSHLLALGMKIDRTLRIKMMAANDIIKQYLLPSPNFVSLDVEGSEMDILQQWDFSNYRPEVFCIETLTFSLDNTGNKRKEIIDFMKNKNYFIFADTHLNTIFVNKACWKGK